jgi:pantothenate kinase
VESIVEELIASISDKVSLLPERSRYILGVTGYPGSGKSTVSQSLMKGVNERLSSAPAIVVPMDGYHFSNEILRQRHLLDLKGIPDTFDAKGFVNLLSKLRTIAGQNVYCPLFDRTIEASIADAIVIEPRHKLCIVEGNYLLLEKQPWDQCRQYLDETWFLDASIDTILPRLLARHIKGGRTPDEAKAKIESTDLPNARLIEETKRFADKLVAIPYQ